MSSSCLMFPAICRRAIALSHLRLLRDNASPVAARLFSINTRQLASLTASATTTHTSPSSSAPTWYSQKMNLWIQQYEDFLGLTEVKEAQSSVMTVRTCRLVLLCLNSPRGRLIDRKSRSNMQSCTCRFINQSIEWPELVPSL